MKSIIIVSLVALLIGAFTLNSGVYNMAATEKHWLITEKIIAWVRDSSIHARAKDLQIPAMQDEDSLAVGAEHYAAMCTECHLAPGRESTELSQGLYPQAPVFHALEPSTNAEEKQDHLKEYFWVIKHGLKMTAMPAWGLTHDDDTIWAMAAFVQELKGMTTKIYTELVGSSSGHHHGHGHDHGHAH